MPIESNRQPEEIIKTAKALLIQREFARADALLESVETATDPTTKRVLADYVAFLRGEAKFGLRQYEAAAMRFRSAQQVDNSKWIDLAQEREADAWSAAENFLRATTLYGQLLKSHSEHPRKAEILLKLANALQASKATVAANARYKEIFLNYPADPAAKLVLEQDRFDPTQLSAEQWLERISRLRKSKRYDDALADLERLRVLHPQARATADLETVWTLRKASRIVDALALVEKLFAQRDVAKYSAGYYAYLRRQKADFLMRLGKVDDAIAYLTQGVAQPDDRATLLRLAHILEDNGRYHEALRLRESLLPQKIKPAQRLAFVRQHAWLLYRAGRYDDAIDGFAQLKKPADRDFALYWTARAYAKSGQLDRAESLYRVLAEKPLDSYYGQAARSRLVDMGTLQIEQGQCSFPATVASAQQPSAALIDQDDALVVAAKSYGEILPGLSRAQRLWRVGLRNEARRELYAVALEFVEAVYRGRFKQYRIRGQVARLWRGGPKQIEKSVVARRATAQRMRQIITQRDELRAVLARVFEQTEVFYFAWRLGPSDPNPIKRGYPRAYYDLVSGTARRYDLDPNLIWAIMRTESVYRPDAVSHVGAAGLMQFMPYTAQLVAQEANIDNFNFGQIFDPTTNLTLAGHYLRALSGKFRGQIPLIAAAYNAGPHNVSRWLDARGKSCEMDEFIEEVPLAEPKRYAKKVVKLVHLYEWTYCQKKDRLVSNLLDPRYSPHPNY